MADLIQFRRGTASAWTTANPILAQGELGLETDTDRVKVGDGTTAWTSLSYSFESGGGGGAGQDGLSVLNGSGAPSSGTGVDGEFYIDTAANDIYGPKTAGAWGSPTSLIGPEGPTGPTGATGATGPAGSNGTDGTNGTDGADLTYTHGSTLPTTSGRAEGDLHFLTA